MHKPHILLLVDKRNWAFHEIANAIAFHLGDSFDFTIFAAQEYPTIDVSQFEIIHVFGGEQEYHLPFINDKTKIIKGIYSHRWEQRGLSAKQFYKKHLFDADVLTVPSHILLNELQDLPIPVYLCPEGVNTGTFTAAPPQQGPMRVGWAGDPDCPMKQLHLAEEACERFCGLVIADGSLSLREMVEFYHSIDIILCTSIAEGCPRPLLEALSCGRFVVTFPVGIAPEIIEHEQNGLIVDDRNVDGLRSALGWCQDHLTDIRASWEQNSKHIHSIRSWEKVVPQMKGVYDTVLTTPVRVPVNV